MSRRVVMTAGGSFNWDTNDHSEDEEKLGILGGEDDRVKKRLKRKRKEEEEERTKDADSKIYSEDHVSSSKKKKRKKSSSKEESEEGEIVEKRRKKKSKKKNRSKSRSPSTSHSKSSHRKDSKRDETLASREQVDQERTKSCSRDEKSRDVDGRKDYERDSHRSRDRDSDRSRHRSDDKCRGYRADDDRHREDQRRRRDDFDDSSSYSSSSRRHNDHHYRQHDDRDRFPSPTTSSHRSLPSHRALREEEDLRNRLTEYCGPPLKPEDAASALMTSVQSQNVSSTTVASAIDEKLAAARKSCEEAVAAHAAAASESARKSKADRYNALLPGGAIAQLAGDPFSEQYGSTEDEVDEDYYRYYAEAYGYDSRVYKELASTVKEEETSASSHPLSEDGSPIVYGTPLLPASTLPPPRHNPYPHIVSLNVDHCVVDPIKESSPSLSAPVLSKLARSTAYMPSPPPISASPVATAPDNTLTPISKKSLAKAGKPGPTALPPGKNAIQFLNEQMPGLPFECIARTGTDNQPVFSMKVEWKGVEYIGEGTSKKAAKQGAALKACNGWFAANKADRLAVEEENKETEIAPMLGFVRSSADGGPAPNAAPISKTPLLLLKELLPNVAFIMTEKEEAKAPVFMAEVNLGGRAFVAKAGTKKMAKNKVSEQILAAKFGMDFTASQDTVAAAATPVVDEEGQKLAERVMVLVMERFYSLTNMGLANTARRKVLAGIVMTLKEVEGIAETNISKVISLGTGTKCIGGEFLSDAGAAINDCHAEIVSRRGLLRFFYDQLKLHLSDDEKTRGKSIFTRVAGGGRPKYKLKDGVDFHLFISSAPCGDGRIFNPHENMKEDGTVDDHPERISRGQLRAKIECGEGTIPVANTANADGIQTWDGIMHGERLLTMSCSDKVARWNVLGVQGSLLSNFVSPIYLKTIVLGSLYHADHLTRALYNRLASPELVNSLPSGYRLNLPLLCRIQSPEVKQDGKTPSFSVNWTLGDEKLEVVDTANGKTLSLEAVLSGQGLNQSPQGVSRLCKRNLFKIWMELNEKLSMLYSAAEDGQKDLTDAYYCDLKTMNEPFQQAKKLMFQTFTERQLGNWVKKPVDQDMFSL